MQSDTVIEFIPDFSLDDDTVISIEEMVLKALGTSQEKEWEKHKKEMRCVIIDVDGTLSNCAPRLATKPNGKFHWEKFFKEMGNDLPNEWCVRLAQIYYQMGFVIYIVTGRPAEYRAETETWLAKYGVPYDFLYMRGTKDNRQDSIVKKEILHTLLPKKELIEFVVDDRQQVVDMWREEGLTCLQCNPHEF